MFGTVVIHSVPKHADEIHQWLNCLGLQQEYRGEGLPSTSYKVLLMLLRRRERMYLTGEQKAQLLEEHSHKCAVCGMRSNQLEWDHTESFATSLDEQTIDSVQPLCPSCHQGKTAAESRAIDNDILVSHFEKGSLRSIRGEPSPTSPRLACEAIWRRAKPLDCRRETL